MSDTWYRDPPPIYDDGRGRLWSLDGTPANQAAFDETFRPRDTDLPPELTWHMFVAQVVFQLRDEYERALAEHWHEVVRGRRPLLSGDWPSDPGIGIRAHQPRPFQYPFGRPAGAPPDYDE